jgi:hypothetical protein
MEETGGYYCVNGDIACDFKKKVLKKTKSNMMGKGDVIECIETDLLGTITKGKLYRVIKTVFCISPNLESLYIPQLLVKNDSGETKLYLQCRFKRIKKKRKWWKWWEWLLFIPEGFSGEYRIEDKGIGFNRYEP